MFKKLLAMSMATLMVLSIVGCGNNGKVADDGRVTILLWEKPPLDAPESVVKEYEYRMEKTREKFPHINIVDEALKPGTDYVQQYDRALMAGQAPTATKMFSYTSIPTRIKNGTIADITNLVGNWDLKNEGKVLSSFDEALSTSDGKWFAIPYAGYVMGTTYNSKAIREGGGDPDNLPTTWAEFAELGQKLTDVSVPRFGYELLGMEWNSWPFTAWVWSAGGEMVRDNGDGTYKITFNEEPGVDAASFWNEMVWKYEMTQKDVLQDISKIIEDVISGRACFAWVPTGELKQENLEPYGLTVADFGFMAMPVKDESIQNPSFTGGEVITFNPKATEEEIKAAWDVFTFMYYDEEMLTESWGIFSQYGSADTQIPGRIDLYGKKLDIFTLIPAQMKADLLEISEVAIPEPFCQNWNDLKNAIASPLQQIILKKDITREEIQKILDDSAEELYAKYPDSFRK